MKKQHHPSKRQIEDYGKYLQAQERESSSAAIAAFGLMRLP